MGQSARCARPALRALRPGRATLAGGPRAAAVDGRQRPAHLGSGRGHARPVAAAAGQLAADGGGQGQQGARDAGQRCVRGRALARSRCRFPGRNRIERESKNSAHRAAHDAGHAGRARQGRTAGRGRPPHEIGGYAVRQARGLVAWALAQLRDAWPATLPELSEAERQQLARTSPHALRHTFGTQTVAAGVPLDVAQRVLGHASLQTTTVYVTAEQRRYFGVRHEVD
ncbi:site-specific integrase [Burkholderia sp. BCC0322]|uniref:site-specific integrase n=1 Tax=unclassified Burkholderia TaxID=2613784 RepID=UPI001FC7CA53|nr:site-specific integrase [Burkholderia sp. BCC0322]